MKAPHRSGRLLSAVVALFVSVMASAPSSAEEAPGLFARFRSLDHDGATAVDVRNQIHLHVPVGETPTPFLPPGRFEGEFTGNLSVDIRSRYSFHMVSGGKATLSIDGEIVAESENGEVTVDRIRLNKGANPVRLTISSPDEGPTFVRVSLQARQDPLLPVMPGALTHETTPESIEASTLARGRAVFMENRCVQCHESTDDANNPELDRDAPSFAGIGTRLNADWMTKWILDPKSVGANATMPRTLHGGSAEEDARAIAAYLSTQIGESPSIIAGDHTLGETLFAELHCGYCHQTPGTESDESLIGLEQVSTKFRPGALAAFLMEPEEHYAWIRMPNFGLASEEAGSLAAFLLGSETIPSSNTSTDETLIDRGEELVQSSGCLNCHQSELPNTHVAPPMTALASSDWADGCAADSPEAGHPHYSLSEAERTDLQAFVTRTQGGVGHHVAAEFATRETKSLQCASCHGSIEVIPPMEWIGPKLKPEWSEKILADTVGYDTRPLMKSRMPAFDSRARLLAHGLAQSSGHAPITKTSEQPIDNELSEIGRKLISADGGFACVSCHGVGDMPAMAIFEVESAGINFAHSFERLQPDFYKSWLFSPVAIDSRTKMPAFFFNGQSPLPTILEGSADRQIDAIWEYLRGGKEMEPPAQP